MRSSTRLVLRPAPAAGRSCLLAFAGDARPSPTAIGSSARRSSRSSKSECYRCHSATAEKLKGGLLLDSREGMLAGGDTGPAVVPGKSGESLLDPGHPARGRPGDAAQEAEARRRDRSPTSRPGSTRGAPTRRGRIAARRSVADARRGPPALGVPAGPEGRPAARSTDAAWVKNPIDAFVLAKLEERGWRPAPPAEPGRVDPPRHVRPDRPAADARGGRGVRSATRRPTPYERVVDRLLDSPRYGERWAQHWLDVVRFAETEGFEYDRHIPDAWRFRDYVIDSLNRDKPFDRFLAEQIAGDEIAPDDPECQTASIFHRLGPVRRNAGNPEIALSRNEVLTERTDIIGTAFLGLTVGCARCHNHKLEPIAQKDYYRLQAYLAATEEHNIVLASEPSEKAVGGGDADDQGRDRAAQEAGQAGDRRGEGRGWRRRSRRSRTRCPPPLADDPGHLERLRAADRRSTS